jgi:hypothetical protein
VAFDQYIWGYYNYYGRGEFLRLVQNEEGGLTYLYSVASGENGAVQNFQYNPATGKWYYFSEPPHDCLSCELAALFSSLNLSDIGHVVLDMAGMAPVLGEAFDFANGLWYVIEGNGTDAALSFAATIPMVYSSTVRYAGRIVKLADGTYQTVKFIGKNAENFIDELKRLTLDAESLRVLNDDLNTTAFATALTENPGLLESWKALYDAGTDPSIRKNIEALTDLDAVEDAIQLLEKAKPTWPEIQAFWKRGNDFNRKGRVKYIYNEINLVDGKRLDSYIPGKEIISRKATTLSKIQPSTFEGYLKELTTKYQKGKEINAPKFGDEFTGEVLRGDYFLEIPTSNKTFFESSQTLQDLAKKYNVQIKYLDE